MKHLLIFFASLLLAPAVPAAPPVNDNYGGPADLGGVLPVNANGTNVEATEEAGEYLEGQMAKTVWYQWTAPADGPVEIRTTGAGFDTVLAVYNRVLGQPQLVHRLAFNDDDGGAFTSRVTLTVTTNQVLAIQVGGFQGANGGFPLVIAPQPPANDNFANATILDSALTVNANGTNVNATTEAGELLAGSMQKTVWFRWESPSAGPVVIRTTGAGFDTMLAAYSVTVGQPQLADRLAFDDDGGGNLTSLLTVNVTAGQALVIQAGGFAGAAGNFPLSITATPPPPDIAVLNPPDDVVPGDFDVGNYAVEGVPLVFVFTVRNTGTGSLTGVSASIGGPEAADFVLTTPPPATLTDFAEATFTVTFTTAVPDVLRQATLTILSSDPDESPLVINLISLMLRFTSDNDGDGLSDAAEHQLRALGFDHLSPQLDLVAALRAGANGAGLYTAEQLQGLHAGASFAARDPLTGRFTIKLGLKKSPDLQNYTDFDFIPAGTSVDAEGNVRFEFEAPGNAAFFKLEVE